MTRRRLVWLGVAACLALAAGLGVWRASRPHPVNRENYERIRVGMTQEEVEAILGGKPYRFEDVGYDPELEAATGATTGKFGLWHGCGFGAHIVFSAEDGTVLHVRFSGGRPSGPLDHLRFRLEDLVLTKRGPE